MENRLDLKTIAQAIGIDTYPDAFEDIYRQLAETDVPACDLDLIDSLQAEYDLFAEFYDLVRQTGEKINADPLRSTWIRVAAAYAMAADFERARMLPVPTSDGTAVMDLLMLYILLPQIPGSIDSYKKRGFSKEELQDLLNAYKGGMRIVQQQTGRPGVNKTYYSWLTHFSKALIYKTEGLQFELRTLPANVLWLRHKENKKILPLMITGTFHASGIQPLGSKNYENEEGAFTVSFSEDCDSYYGHGVFDSVVSSECQAFSKKEWDCLAKPGDPCLGMHIPRGTDISREATQKACKSALKIAAERYPEYGAQHIVCSSWLLNPRLKEIQGPQSRITQFMEHFTKFPTKDPIAGAVFSFVFVRQPENLEDLPEDTSLRRKLKKMYLEGDCIHTYSGMIFEEE